MFCLGKKHNSNQNNDLKQITRARGVHRMPSNDWQRQKIRIIPKKTQTRSQWLGVRLVKPSVSINHFIGVEPKLLSDATLRARRLRKKLKNRHLTFLKDIAYSLSSRQIQS
jgi:hypothetical protein